MRLFDCLDPESRRAIEDAREKLAVQEEMYLNRLKQQRHDIITEHGFRGVDDIIDYLKSGNKVYINGSGAQEDEYISYDPVRHLFYKHEMDTSFDDCTVHMSVTSETEDEFRSRMLKWSLRDDGYIDSTNYLKTRL